MTTERVTRFLFSSDALPPEDRLAIWAEDRGQHQRRHEIDPDVARANEPRRDGNDRPAFSWVRRSDDGVLDDDGTSPCDASDGILLLSGAASSFAIEHCAPLINVRLDGALFRSRIPDIEAQLLRRPPSNNAALNLLQAYLDALLANGIPADPVFAQIINEHIVDLIAASLRPGDDKSEPAARNTITAARLAAAKSDIRSHLCDPALSARQVAQRLELSERSIYLLFERSGLSFASFVTEERLKLAFAILLDPARQRDRIGDIALAAGFSDISTFNRGFRRRYGRTPTSLRRSGPER